MQLEAETHFYRRKLYALLHNYVDSQGQPIYQQLECFRFENLEELESWWRGLNNQPQEISSSSDRVNIRGIDGNTGNTEVQIRHPISAEPQTIEILIQNVDISEIASEQDVKKVFWWFWRFYPEASGHREALLQPAHKFLPDCPIHSYNSTVSAITGAMCPPDWLLTNDYKQPYLLLFTFSPVQEFIKASRKFLDFWAGSYLLHYLGAKLCWHIAQKYGPDAVITPSLWSQEIIDAFMMKEFDNLEEFTLFKNSFEKYSIDKLNPVSRFESRQSTSLSTAGFPNVITAVVPGREGAAELAKELGEKLRREWTTIASKVRKRVKQDVIRYLQDQNNFQALKTEFSSDADIRDLEKWQQHGCWEWNKLWDAQIDNTWETYWISIPLGAPGDKLIINKESDVFNESWKQAQEELAQTNPEQSTPTQAEEAAYNTLNVGTWWGSLQSRLGTAIQAVKNTRTWKMASAPGERSTLSGQFSAIHPTLHYQGDFREGGGVPAGSMRLFWAVMGKVYSGLFNGSEKLNALEMTKRMAWVYGGVAGELDVRDSDDLYQQEIHHQGQQQFDYEKLIRFPNLSSIAAAKFAYKHPEIMHQYWQNLENLIRNNLPKYRALFYSRTRLRPFQVPKTDARINPSRNDGGNYNGVMFSSKWLADDMNLKKNNDDIHSREKSDLETLPTLVEEAHNQSDLSNGSPADWWVIILGDGDGMGKYVSGEKLKTYKEYIEVLQVAEASTKVAGWDKLLETKKRMGPATHVGLNRALLDFSNRLVPYLTEHRFCGKVIYSGGDDVMAVLPLEDLPEYLLSLRAAWCGGEDICGDIDSDISFTSQGGYWFPQWKQQNTDFSKLPNRPLFTMGEGATMSIGIIIAHKSVPLPTVLENLWEAEKSGAKKMPDKNGLCFRIIYGGGNTLEALMNGNLLESWWQFIKNYRQTDLSPLLYRLADELPLHGFLSPNHKIFRLVAEVILTRREQTLDESVEDSLLTWLDKWEEWAWSAGINSLGTQTEDLAMLLRFSAFWVDKMRLQMNWEESSKKSKNQR
ncbi:MAG: type III-B CRISPR-associated protein Cas10/Cmr2 [Brasilonema octagenarum HA4186-MV1]|jgi:CRISPR-associated protein Cmr2|nr:type III-B CRISPR-associated protein Cas10/Cmr2 [Brasilonema octagenarum HA4186-MV1]